MDWPFKGRKKIVVDAEAYGLTAEQLEGIEGIMVREGRHRIVSADTLKKLEFDSQRKAELEAENQELLKRPCVEKYGALQSQQRDLEGEVLQLRPLKERVPALEKENQGLDAQVAQQGGIVQQLQQVSATLQEIDSRKSKRG